jgi:small conductance mechanosensitive channel
VSSLRRLACMIVLFCTAVCVVSNAQADQQLPKTALPEAAPIRVDVKPTTRDAEIENRLQSILIATGWFARPSVEVTDGVAFLEGEAESEEFKTWAGALARNTQDVVAVVNKMDVRAAPWWSFEPALTGLRTLTSNISSALPTAVFSFCVLVLAWYVGRLAAYAAQRWIGGRLSSPLLCAVLARCLHFAVFLIGLYIVLQLGGLTNIAFTVVGGTGLLGLILGIAFREITENFLASMFLTLQQPFQTEDLVEISGVLGFVERLTARATTLLTLDGNHVQIPNATVYKSVIRNYTSNPNRRDDFVVGIGYEDSISSAQQVAQRVLDEHPAVLKDPEPWVLVESLGKSTVNLRVYFWLDGSKHSWLKVRSSLIRLTKAAFQGAGISMPDEAREVVFPNGVPVRMIVGDEAQTHRSSQHAAIDDNPAATVTRAEGGLTSEADELVKQARRSRIPEDENLLKPPPASKAQN